MEHLLVVVLGFVLSFLIGLTGVGGGALVAPALYVVLGLTYTDAVALSLAYSVFTKIVSAAQHLRQGTVLWKITLLYGLTGVPGAIIGSRLMYWTGPAASERIFPPVMGGLLVLVALLILSQATIQRLATWQKPFSPHAFTMGGVLAIAAFQLIVGAVLGFTSVGSGSLVIVSMLYLFQMNAKEIVGCNIVIALMMVLPAGIVHYSAGSVRWKILALLLLGSLAGAVLGAKVTLLVPDRVLTFVIALLIVAAAVATVAKAWSS